MGTVNFEKRGIQYESSRSFGRPKAVHWGLPTGLLLAVLAMAACAFPASALAEGPPNTTITGGSQGKVTPDVSFTFTSSEAGSEFECELDGNQWTICASPKSYQGLPAGSHTIRVRAVDAEGTDPTPAERTVTVVGMAKAVSGVTVLDNFGRFEAPLANGNWTKMSWAKEIGGSWGSPYHGYGGEGPLAGAYWNSATYSDGSAAVLAAATVGTGSTGLGEYLSLWLDMPAPGTARSGYEARFAGTNGTSSGYKVELSKWVGGTRTVLASQEGVSLPVGTTFALTETGGRLTVWAEVTISESTFFWPYVTAYDATWSSGYAGISAKGTEGTAYNFRAGNVS